MPQLVLTTNIEYPTEKTPELRKQLSGKLAEWLGKPEDYCLIVTQFGCGLSFGGSEEPAATLILSSLGLPEESIPGLSSSICDALQELLGLDPSRVYIQFSSPPRTHWGWNGKTFG